VGDDLWPVSIRRDQWARVVADYLGLSRYCAEVEVCAQFLNRLRICVGILVKLREIPLEQLMIGSQSPLADLLKQRVSDAGRGLIDTRRQTILFRREKDDFAERRPP